MVVQVSERKTRLMDVDQEESMGIAKSEARGRVSGVRRAVRDMFWKFWRLGMMVRGWGGGGEG